MRGDELVGIITETDIFKVLAEALGSDKPGHRIDVVVPDQKGVLAQLAQVVYEAGGNIASMVVLRASDTEHGQVSIKEYGANIELLRKGLAELPDTQLVELQPSGKDVLLVLGKK